MTEIGAKVICDSISEDGARLTTLECVYPRFIHSEVMTYRMWSRNTASSRAIPLKKTIEMVRSDPAMPVFWGKNQPGMQAREPLDEDSASGARLFWHQAKQHAIEAAECMERIGLHKQTANRILEPFLYHTAVITATAWEHCWYQRIHPDAQPEFQVLAKAMKAAIDGSTPTLVFFGGWHAPYTDRDERVGSGMSAEEWIKVSVARCARVSYLTHDGRRDPQEDIRLYRDLREATPPHWSPLEHVATPLPTSDWWAANFKGWKSWRWIEEPNGIARMDSHPARWPGRALHLDR